VKGILADGNTGNRLIVVHAVSEASKYNPHKHNTQTQYIAVQIQRLGYKSG